MSNTWSDSILSWLEQILKERYGYSFNVSRTASGDTIITLNEHAGKICLEPDSKTFTRADSELPFTSWNAAQEGWAYAIEPVLPVPGKDRLSLPIIIETSEGYVIKFDVLGLAYWMLSRQEEVGRKDLDEFGRFPAKSSHAFKFGYLDRPVVDEWLYILGQVMQRLWPQIKLKQHCSTLILSHDVDRPSRYIFRSGPGLIRAIFGDVIKYRQWKNGFMAPWIRYKSRETLHPADPFNAFNWLMDASERQGLKSAFYFISGRTNPKRDADYELEHPVIRRLIGNIHSRGHEIGLHPSFESYKSTLTIKSEAERLWRVCDEEGVQQHRWGGRMHYLRWEQPVTLQAWNDVGLAYDSTLGYADMPGFRCGTCFEYPAVNPVTQEQLALRIRPLIAMECSIISGRYMGLGVGKRALNQFLQLKERCFKVDGSFSLLWHNSELYTAELRDLYKKVIS